MSDPRIEAVNGALQMVGRDPLPESTVRLILNSLEVRHLAERWVWCDGGTDDPTAPYVKYVAGPYRETGHRDCPGAHRRVYVGEPVDGTSATAADGIDAPLAEGDRE